MRTRKQYGAMRGWIVVNLIVAALGTSIQAQTTITTFSIADSTIFPNAFTNTNRGLQPEMYVGDAGVGSPGGRPVVQFSLASIPAGQLITSATLRMYMGGTTQYSTDGYRLLSSWVEGDGVSGLDSGTSGVTWDRRDKAGTLANWVLGGASGSGSDRAATASFTLTAADVSGDFVSKDVTSDAQGWYNVPSSNFGWLLQATTYTAGQFTRYGAREQGGTVNDPQLIITYVPEPSSALLLLGGLALLRLRKQR